MFFGLYSLVFLAFVYLGSVLMFHKSAVLDVVVSLCSDKHKSHFVSRAHKIYINILSKIRESLFFV